METALVEYSLFPEGQFLLIPLSAQQAAPNRKRLAPVLPERATATAPAPHPAPTPTSLTGAPDRPHQPRPSAAKPLAPPVMKSPLHQNPTRGRAKPVADVGKTTQPASSPGRMSPPVQGSIIPARLFPKARTKHPTSRHAGAAVKGTPIARTPGYRRSGSPKAPKESCRSSVNPPPWDNFVCAVLCERLARPKHIVSRR